MAHDDFRTFFGVAEQAGHARRITKPVDATWEPAAMAKWAFQALPHEKRFGLFFENVDGSEMRLATGCIGANQETYALALGVEQDQVRDKWVEALLNPIEPVTVDSGPCQEVIKLGADAKLSELPIPVWTPGKDVAPYITTGVVNCHVDTGVQNMGIYRTMVKDDHTVVANMNPGRQGYEYCKTWFAQGKPAPVVWVIAPEPVVQIVSTANLPHGESELRIAGGLKGKPVEMVKCQTNDMLVPANSEIIIEGEMIEGETDMEGPFGEFAGYMGPVAPKPVVRITAITHRKNAIYYGITSQMPPSESTMLQSMSNAPLLYKQLVHDLNETCVNDVFIDLTFGGLLAHGVIQMTPRRPDDAMRIGRLVGSISPLKRITLVDADVDPRDPLHMEWAMNSRYNPATDTEIQPDVWFPMGMDPSVRSSAEASDLGSRIIINATKTIDAGVFSLPSMDIMEKAKQSWLDSGLPDFEVPKRAQYRFENS